jgi:hypothetical protein
MFCPECGQDHHAGERAETAAADRELEIVRVNAKRDIEIARINAGAVRTEADAGALTDIVTPPEAEPAPAPEIIVAPEPEPEPETEPEVMAPPVKNEHGGYGNSAFFSGR